MNPKHKKHEENYTKHIKSSCSKPMFNKKILEQLEEEGRQIKQQISYQKQYKQENSGPTSCKC